MDSIVSRKGLYNVPHDASFPCDRDGKDCSACSCQVSFKNFYCGGRLVFSISDALYFSLYESGDAREICSCEWIFVGGDSAITKRRVFIGTAAASATGKLNEKHTKANVYLYEL